MSAQRRSPGQQGPSSPKRVTPAQHDKHERPESSHFPAALSARKATPTLVVSSAKKSRDAREPREADSVTPKGAHGSASASPYDTMGTTASQMLFSPDATQRQATRQQRASPARMHIIASSPGSATKTTTTSGNTTARPASAPRLRPQSLSAQLAAHSEHSQSLFSDPPGHSVGHTGGSAGSVLSPTAESQGITSRRSPAATKAPTSDNGSVPVVSSAAPSVTSPNHANPSSGGKVRPPTHNAPSHPPVAGAHTHSHIPKAVAVRSADVLSANKAAKKAALALQAQPHSAHTTHSSGPSSAAHPSAPNHAGNAGVARYLQPTHSSAAATTALLTNPTSTNKVQKTRIPAYARPTLNSAGIAAPGNDEAPTPSRVSKLTKRAPSTHNAHSTNARNHVSSVPLTGGLRRKESLEKLPSPSSTTTKTNKTLKTSLNNANKPKTTTGKLESSHNTSHNGTFNVSTIMNILEGTSNNQKMSGNEGDGVDMPRKQTIRRVSVCSSFMLTFYVSLHIAQCPYVIWM